VTWFLGVDVGGTFTDVVLGSSDAAVHTAKVLTTPHDPREGVVRGVAEALAAAGIPASAVSRVVHGTTLATNVILERRGGRVVFVTTEGFADLLRLGREARVEGDRFDLWFEPPHAPVPRAHTVEVPERIDAAGREVVALDRRGADAVAAAVAAMQPAAVAVCLLNSYANPSHELLVEAACTELLPAGTFIATSTHISPEMREYERAMTTVMCAYVGPVMASYLTGLGDSLAGLGITCGVEIMDSSGGVLSTALAAARPVATVESGGAAGVTAAGFVGAMIGRPAVLSFDMGGTTAKAGIVRGGRPALTHDFQVGGKGSFGGARPGTGFPLRIPAVDLAEVGAGGGSIAWVDPGGALHVGPRSAGAVPGPACYGFGGDSATVTDADLVLGYLNPRGLAGGVTLSAGRSREVLERDVAAPLGLDLRAAAWAVHEVANATMAAAIRVVTIQRGIDPRQFTLVAFGGAGPMHAARLADTFGMREVVVPRAAGVAAGIGLVSADPAVQYVRTRLLGEDEIDVTVLTSVFAELEAQGREALGAGPSEDLTVERSLDVRVRGQAHQLTIPVEVTDAGATRVGADFRSCYRATYGIETTGLAEVVTFRTRTARPVATLRPAPAGSAPTVQAIPSGSRDGMFSDAAAMVAAPVHLWDALAPGACFDGPALVDGSDTTVVVPPGWSAVADGWCNLRLGSSS